MEMEVDALTGAAWGEKSEERLVQRNGYRERDWATRAGTVALHIPKLRQGSYFPGLLPRRRESADGGDPGGLHPRHIHPSVDALVKALGLTGVSKSQVSRVCAEIDERVQAFLNRPLEGKYRYLWIDATYVKVRPGLRTQMTDDRRGNA